MRMAKEYVVMGAKLECNKGTAPSNLVVLPVHHVKLTDKLKANIGDCVPNTNVLPFAMCTSSVNPLVIANRGAPVPCTPTCSIWINGKSDLLLDGMPALLTQDKAVCPLGAGMIEVKDSGQGDSKQRFVDMYEENNPEHADKMNEFLKPLIDDGNFDSDVVNIKYMAYRASEPYKSVMFEYLPNLSIGSHTHTGTQNYSSTQNALFVNLAPNAGEGDPRGPYVTFFHELGHGVDDQMRKAGTFDQSTSGLQGLLQSDTEKKIEDTIKSFDSDPDVVSAVMDSFRPGGTPVAAGSVEEDIRNRVIDEYKGNLTYSPDSSGALVFDQTKQRQSNQATDILGGYTENQLGGNGISGYGHANSYWDDPRRTNPQSSEFFAHNFSANVTKNQEKKDLINAYFPSGREHIESNLSEVAKNLGGGGN